MRIARRVGLIAVATLVVTVTVACGIKLPTKKTAVSGSEPTVAVDDRNTNFRPGASELKNAVQAGKRAAQLHDFQQLGTIIFALELQNNKMPTKDEIVADLKANVEARDLLKKINEGVIILTGTADPHGLWMYEVDADKAGGIVYYGGRAERKSAAEVKQLLGQK
jgi:hypothetical protein